MSKHVIQGISIEPETLEEGKARARRLGRSFSRHVCKLVEDDLIGGSSEPTKNGNQRNRQGNGQRGRQSS